MEKTIERKFEVGDWVKPDKRVIKTDAKYINVTKNNVERLNTKSKYDSREAYLLVEGDEIREAEKYLEALMNIKVGDYIKNVNGEIDKITGIPEIENKFEIDSYALKAVDTEKNIAGSWMWMLFCPDAKVSREEAKRYTQSVLNLHKNMISFYENRLREFD